MAENPFTTAPEDRHLAVVVLLRALATGSIYRDHKHDIILRAAADEIERLRAVNANLVSIVIDDTEGDLDFIKFQFRSTLTKPEGE